MDPLDFGEFDLHDSGGRGEAARIEVNQSHIYRQVPDSPGRDDVPHTKDATSKSFWTFEYYQQFFDVDTEQVKTRILWGMIPRPGINYIHSCIQPNPDLYGPFWICVTLVFTIAISGNVVNYLHYAPTGDYEWKYDFHLISYAATAIFSYAFVIPLALWGVIKSNEYSQAPLTFLELLCLYGYSLGIYVPVSIMLAVQINWLQWTMVIIGASLSGFVLLTTIAPSLHGPKKILILAVVAVLHYLLAAAFMLYFFHTPTLTPALVSNTIADSLNKTETVPVIHSQPEKV